MHGVLDFVIGWGEGYHIMVDEGRMEGGGRSELWQRGCVSDDIIEVARFFKPLLGIEHIHKKLYILRGLLFY